MTASLSAAPKLPVTLLEEAATWYVQLQDSAVTAQDHTHWQQWFDSDTRH
jgi:ferric-dicitrate binding protein FerR (iron transport regulator)